MRWAQLRRTLTCGLLLGAPAAGLAQPPPYNDQSVSVYDDHYDVSVAGEPVASVDVFYDQLSPHGVWLDEPYLGRVFTPVSPRFVPYTDGHWQYTGVGFVWVSPEPFAWATSHYGRWAYSHAFDRWVWVPDTVWGPSWVEWRMSGDDFGWAPLAPEVAIEVGYTRPAESWHYCPAARVLDVNVTRYYEPPRRVIEIHRVARPIEHYATISGTRVVVGPSTATLREHHVAARPVKIAAHTVGRWTSSEAQAAAKRAQDRRAVNEEQNRRRIESNAGLRQAQAKVATSMPRRPGGNPPANQPTPRQEPQDRESGRTDRHPQVQQEPRPQATPERRPEPHPQAKPERPQEPRPQAAPERRPEPRPQVQPEPPRPAPRQEPGAPERKQEPRQPNPSPANREPRADPRQPNPPPQRPEPREQPRQPEKREPQQPPAKQESRPAERGRSEAKQPERREQKNPPPKRDGE